MNLPLVPQHHHRKTKNYPKNCAAYIVHGKVDPVEDEDEGDGPRGGAKNVGFTVGTGS
jgi:hypothetical protein